MPDSTPRVEVVGVGAATWDDFWLVEEFSADERVAPALNQLSMGGGPVATALCFLSHLGHPCALVDAQGEDLTGSLIATDLQTAGIALDHLQRSAGARSARATILVRRRDGARQIVYAPSTTGEPVWGQRENDLLTGARLLHLNGRHEATARAAVQAAQRSAVTISFDGGAGRYRDSIRDLFLASHLRIVAWEFAQRFTGQSELSRMMQALLEPPAQIAVITASTRGSWVATPEMDMHHQPAFTATPLVDTTGCGDIYHGAFLHGWLGRWDPIQCAAYASAQAARNAQGLGGKCLIKLISQTQEWGPKCPLPTTPGQE
ncbi:MAG: PfkB family carbohydrate kinase [Prosthecobacter sp.]|nr:PfkB family carbohydrate kinase [Prosthecobacter sp.]